MGPMLGGGHGLLQGNYGFMADNLVEARLVLADGNAITVSENSSYPDLFWGLRGAGHNFGVVSSFKYKIYDKNPKEKWTLNEFYFAEEKLEDVYSRINDITSGGKKLQPVQLGYFSFFLRIPDIDKDHVSQCP
jgi:FAD/FMN-containing dehydrogenase